MCVFKTKSQARYFDENLPEYDNTFALCGRGSLIWSEWWIDRANHPGCGERIEPQFDELCRIYQAGRGMHVRVLVESPSDMAHNHDFSMKGATCTFWGRYLWHQRKDHNDRRYRRLNEHEGRLVFVSISDCAAILSIRYLYPINPITIISIHCRFFLGWGISSNME